MSTKGTPQESHDFHPSKPFDDPRIIWAAKAGHLDEGWVLPGGMRTRDRVRAQAAAVNLDALNRKAGA